MPNPYASTGSVATVTSSIAGGADDLTGGGPGSAPKLSTGTVLARLAAYVRPHAGLFVPARETPSPCGRPVVSD